MMLNLFSVCCRSSEDDYCPTEDVDYIQQKAIQTMKELYGEVTVELDYLNDEHQSLQQ